MSLTPGQEQEDGDLNSLGSLALPVPSHQQPLGPVPVEFDSLCKSHRIKVYSTQEGWLLGRRNYITSSDAPSIMGYNKYSAALSVAYEKWGKETEDYKDTTQTRFGKHNEAFIANEYALETKRKTLGFIDLVKHYAATYGGIQAVNGFFISPDCEYLSATPDYFIYDNTLGLGILECKGGLDPQEHDEQRQYCQLQHQLMVTGLKWGAIARLSYRGQFSWQGYDADLNLHARMRENYATFWAYVQMEKIPTPVDGSERTTDILKKLFADRLEEGVLLKNNIEAQRWNEQYIAAQESIKAHNAVIKGHELKKREAENNLRVMLGKHNFAWLDDCYYVIDTVNRDGYKVPPTSYTQLKRVKLADGRKRGLGDA